MVNVDVSDMEIVMMCGCQPQLSISKRIVYSICVLVSITPWFWLRQKSKNEPWVAELRRFETGRYKSFLSRVVHAKNQFLFMLIFIAVAQFGNREDH